MAVTWHGARELAAVGKEPPSSRRRSAIEAEHARRVAWGKKWGRLVSEATAAWREEGK